MKVEITFHTTELVRLGMLEIIGDDILFAVGIISIALKLGIYILHETEQVIMAKILYSWAQRNALNTQLKLQLLQ